MEQLQVANSYNQRRRSKVACLMATLTFVVLIVLGSVMTLRLFNKDYHKRTTVGHHERVSGSDDPANPTQIPDTPKNGQSLTDTLSKAAEWVSHHSNQATDSFAAISCPRLTDTICKATSFCNYCGVDHCTSNKISCSAPKPAKVSKVLISNACLSLPNSVCGKWGVCWECNGKCIPASDICLTK
mmetsp:Transcript_27012/g.30124  ORF Transcript_27012/g.30124 Transcript_27012/m.30124 type:complete len:185 (+) Transcript_27012:29-583(+)